jgi:hypothetical protein
MAFVDAQTLAGKRRISMGRQWSPHSPRTGAGNRVERSRGFIVPDEWPEQAQRYARQ